MEIATFHIGKPFLDKKEEFNEIVDKIDKLGEFRQEDRDFLIYSVDSKVLARCFFNSSGAIVCIDMEHCDTVPEAANKRIFVCENGEIRCIEIDPETILPEETLLAAHRATLGNKAAMMAREQKCFCLSCCTDFLSTEFEEEDFIPEGNGEWTARCPDCGVDAILCEDSGFPMTEKFLLAVHRRFFSPYR